MAAETERGSVEVLESPIDGVGVVVAGAGSVEEEREDVSGERRIEVLY